MAGVGAEPSSGVTTFNGRNGAVVPTTGDYTAAQVTNAADKASGSTQTFSASVNTSVGFQALVGSGNDILLNRSGSTSYIQFGTNASPPQLQCTSPGANTPIFCNVVFAPKGISTQAITSGALPTISFSSGTAAQVTVTRDVFLNVPVTYTPTAGAAATCKVEISPDNVTFSTLSTEQVPAGTALDSFVRSTQILVPAGWYVKLTVTNATLAAGTYY